MDSLDYDTYGLSEIVLFGNSKRMILDCYLGLEIVFLDNRVKSLVKCFNPKIVLKQILKFRNYNIFRLHTSVNLEEVC